MKMRLFLLLCIEISAFVSVWCIGAAMIGTGVWMVEDVMSCEEPENYDMTFEVTRERLNRTHDGFSLYISYDKDITEDIGIEIDIYKLVDGGGYKYYQHVTDESACNFARYYSKENLEKILRLAGVDPPDCPVAAGEYKASNFVFDYSELTDPFPYGTYEVHCYMTYLEQRVACIKLYATFQEKDDDKQFY